jgi:hypothetical protein
VAQEVTLIADPPGLNQEPADCLLASNATMKTCTTTWNAAVYASNGSLAKLARKRRFGYLDTRGWFCDRYTCPSVIGHTIAYRDTGHITQTYAKQLAAPFRSSFRRCLFSSCPP